MEIFLQNPYLIALLLIWVLPWKGYGMWLAAKRKEKWWFIALLILNTLGILEILYIFYFSKRDQGGSLKGEEKEIEVELEM
jgi:hypothetical protein